VTDGGPRLGVVIPTLNEEEALPLLLSDLDALPFPVQVLVVDGGSRDRTRELARVFGAEVLEAPRGRARQMEAGVGHSSTPWLLLLHADCRVPVEAREALTRYLEHPGPERAAHFGFRLDANGPWWRAIEVGQRVREALTGLAYGDQGLLVSRERLEQAGGVPDLPLMEDVALVRQLRRTGGIRRLPAALVTSSRRYREEGPFLGWLRNATLITLYGLGVSPERLSRWYRPRRSSAPGGSTDPESPPAWLPTLLVFAKAPLPGRVKTRLAGELGEKGAADLYRRMGRLVVDRVRTGPWRTVICYDPPGEEGAVRDWLRGGAPLEYRPQTGGDLGARMADAFAAGFERAHRSTHGASSPGGAPVVVIGTDAPDLDRAIVAEAFRSLQRPGGPGLVLGPATDGGYYLLGLRSPAPDLFRDIPWSTDRVLEGTLAKARDLGLRHTLLEPLSDVDRPEDVPAALAALPEAGEESPALLASRLPTGPSSGPHPPKTPSRVWPPTR
jgi:rSAM/selenodomain-associated transferase 2/rSAM/selenodomain-associated transferase 1